MAIQRWWEETKHELFYHTARDEAYMRHHFREEVERNLRDIIRHQRAQMALQAEIARAQIETIEHGFTQLGSQISDLAETVSWALETVGEAITSLERTVVSEFQQTRRLLSWGFSELIWQQELTNQLLQDILKKLSSPRTTEAEEMRERGNEFYRNGINSKRPEDRERWINLAIEAYLEAIRKNPADFSVFLSLGIIQFFEKGNSELALRCFREAAALAEPYSPYHSALSWVHLGYVHRNRNEFEEAYQATAEAISLQPDWAEAHYQHAVHCALTGRMDEMRAHLTKAIELDETYFPKAATDPDFLPFDEVREVLDTLTQTKKQRAQTLQSILTRCQKVISGLIGSQNEIYAFLTSVLQNLQQAQDYVALRRAIPQTEDAFKQIIPKLANLTNYHLSIKVEDKVHSVAFSPDGQFLASGSADKTIKLWLVSV